MNFLPEVRWDCVVRLKLRGITQHRLKQFLEHVANVADMYSAEDFVVEIPDSETVPRKEKSA